MTENRISLYQLHDAQKKIKASEAKYKLLNCGRRFGKSTYMINELIEPAIGIGRNRTKVKPLPTAFFGYDYKTLKTLWDDTKGILGGAIKDKDEQLKQLKLYSGANIDFWTTQNKNAGRSKKYKKVLCDEFAFWNNSEETLQQAIMPTLADYNGDMEIASTPKGTGNYWHKLCTNPPKNFEYFHYTIYDNPHIPRESIEQLRLITDPKAFAQEYMGEFVDFAGEPFFYNYDSNIHLVDELEIDPNYPVLLSFDFNINPCTVVLMQKTHEGIRVIKEIKANGGINALLPKLDFIREYTYEITGDSNGHAGSASDVTTCYDTIKAYLGVKPLPITKNSNATHDFSQKLCNQAFFSLGDKIKVSRKGCPSLCQGLGLAQTKISASGRVNLAKNDENEWSHFVDCFRYGINRYFKVTKEIIMYSRLTKAA